ncbi:hypothetical protein BJF85_07060 [Saccharomonospora sp. CUA-673]|uniref:DUF5994 family protein n=1 Tax=Saccharomonospora sp. CUA-673 TaxID=1904969 RepID=UPI0009690C8B|nr:DUF5994 family protein [Saccharomonospora sp. CUA-673]OLT38986.1 hypothetical protein BJF85_07060 [Saccharomonospora sp. CUA-673]
MAMKPAGSIPGYVDGEWWPRSGDLAAEVAELVSALESWVGIVSRVSFHLGTWGTVPRKALVEDRIVRFGGFLSMDPNTVTVIGVDSRLVSLLVVPSDAPRVWCRL